MMNRAGFVPVHNDPGGVTFKYEVTPFNFANSLKPTAATEDAGNAIDERINFRNEEAPRSGDDEEAVPDFLGFEDDMQPEVSCRETSSFRCLNLIQGCLRPLYIYS
jgi:hypothetical protein